MLFITLFFLILQNSEEKIRLIGGVVDAYHQNFDFSGNILVADSNSIVYQRSLGMANYELNVANTAQTRFRLASISKQFTAAALLILEQKSQVDFNQAISRYLPQLKKDLAEQITIHQLLSHSSGLQRDIEELTDQELGHSYISLSEIVELINRSSLVFKPGERWLYSNLGYALAAAIIESVTQKDFATALKTLIFDPLLMRHTGHETNFDLIENRASGYVQLPDGIIKAGYEDKSYVIGAGSIYSTVGDLLIWSRELMNGNLLSKANIKRLYTRQSGRYSYGWFVDSYVWPPVNDDHTAVNLHHDGGSPGFEANLSLLIRHKSVVIILTNKLPSYFQGLSNRITNVYLGFDETPPKADGSKELFDQLFNRSLESAKALIEQWQKSDRKNLVPDKNAIFQIGRAYLDSEQLERASLTFSLISELVPKWWMPYLFYGIAMEKMGKKEEAIKLYNQVLELKPDQSNAASRLAKLKK